MIRLRFVQGLGWGSQLIALVSDGHLSHVDAMMPDGTLLGARSDSIGWPPHISHDFNWSGVRRRPNPYEDVAKVVIYEIQDTTAEQDAKFYGFLASQEGKPYDHLAILAFGFGRNWRDMDAWYCSELIAAGLELAGILRSDLFLGVNKIKPVVLAALVSDLPNARQTV